MHIIGTPTLGLPGGVWVLLLSPHGARADVAPPWSTPIRTLRVADDGGSMCLDIPGGDTRPGTPLQLWHCFDGDQNQLFHFVTATGELRDANDLACVDAGSDFGADG